jgi:hypothetical protein
MEEIKTEAHLTRKCIFEGVIHVFRGVHCCFTYSVSEILSSANLGTFLFWV